MQYSTAQVSSTGQKYSWTNWARCREGMQRLMPRVCSCALHVGHTRHTADSTHRAGRGRGQQQKVGNVRGSGTHPSTISRRVEAL